MLYISIPSILCLSAARVNAFGGSRNIHKSSLEIRLSSENCG